MFKMRVCNRPEAAVETFLWAATHGNKERMEEVFEQKKFHETVHELRRKLEPDFKEEDGHEHNFTIKSFKPYLNIQGTEVQLLPQPSRSTEPLDRATAFLD
jgi:hypothetical protein